MTYERYCYFTCKPIIPNALSTNVPCERLTADEIKLQVRLGRELWGQATAPVFEYMYVLWIG